MILFNYFNRIICIVLTLLWSEFAIIAQTSFKFKIKNGEISVKPHNAYGDEQTIAYEWLTNHGLAQDSLCFDIVKDYDSFMIVSDSKRKCSAIIAKKKYWDMIGNPVLAYSLNNYISLDNNSMKLFQKFLQKQLSLSKNSDTVCTQHYKPRYNFVPPFLGNLHWGQGSPYNRLAPNVLKTKKQAIVGCVPLAMAMAMSRYQWPQQGQSHIYYKPGSITYSMDFTKCRPQWEKYKNSYTQTDTVDVKNLSHLLVSLGMAVDVSFSNNATGASMSNVKHVMCNNLGYSSKLTYRYGYLTTEELLALLYYEIDASRPVIVSNGEHAFVCDGYDGDFFHFNFGWEGFCNGFYRLKVGNHNSITADSLIFIKGLIYGIEPENIPKESIVELKDAGTLGNVLSQDEKENTTKLIIKGKINSCDIKLIRKMAGAATDSVINSWRGGCLQHLDLTEASIVSDQNPYYAREANGQWRSTRTNAYGHFQSTTYDFKNMDLKMWKEFKNNIGSKQHGMFYTRTDDNRYWIHYCCTKSEIGKWMFSNCSSLKSILLPTSIKKIDDFAFYNCSSLLEIHIPPKVQEIGETPFLNCLSLEKIEIFKKTTITPTLKQDLTPGKADGIAENCSPILQTVTRYDKSH